LIDWQSHIQKSTSLSLEELELIALFEYTQDILWVSKLLQETIHLTPNLCLFNNNLSTQAILTNKVYHHGTCHLPFKYYFMHNKVKSKQVELNYMPTCSLLANLMTKNLTRDKIKDLLNGLLTVA
jgi:hypothetical protein